MRPLSLVLPSGTRDPTSGSPRLVDVPELSRRSVRLINRHQPSDEEDLMPQKSPQRPAGKKPGKSLKEKREAKREKKRDKRPLEP